MSTPPPNPIADLAQWPATEADVTVANMTRALLVWAKVYECRLVNAIGDARDDAIAPVLATASLSMASTGRLLQKLNSHDPAQALYLARQQWQIGDDGEVGSDLLLEALDRIDPDLAEQVVVAYQAVAKAEAST